MIKSVLLGMTTTLAMSTLAISLFVAAPTGTLNILSAYAEPNIHSEFKEKSYVGEGGDGASSLCIKDSGFLSSCENVGNVNKDAREACEEFTDSKCKQRK
jgi:hypothetical protein